jgi:hypothetical protein
LYQALLHFFSTTMKNEIDQEKFLLKKIHDIGTEVKINKDNVNFIKIKYIFKILKNLKF